jgi:hypothetical protein
MGHPGKDWVVLAETEEDQGSRTLVRNIETFRRVDQFYRRGCEVHRIRLFDTAALLDRLTGGRILNGNFTSLQHAAAWSAWSRFFPTRMPPKEPAPRQMALN